MKKLFGTLFGLSLLQAQLIDYNTQLKNKPTPVIASAYNWLRTNGLGLAANLSVAGANTITLTPCPVGVAGANTNHYIYISAGTGTPEVALITGGTCTSGAATGTINVTTINTHTDSFTASSATAGIREAIISVGNYGGVALGCGTHEIYAPIHISYRVSLTGCGLDSTYLHNNSATTGVINYTALTPAGDQDTFGGATFYGFTIYSGAKNNVAVDTTVADAVYTLGVGWNFTIRDVFVRNHTVGFHHVNGWSAKYEGIGVRFFRDYGILVERDLTVGAGTEAGAGNGADLTLNNVWISNVGATGTQTDTGCATRFALWSGLYVNNMNVTATKWGLCLQPRPLRGAEQYSFIYYGRIENSSFDTTEHGGILLDGRDAPSGTNGIVQIEFSNITSAYNGCVIQTQPLNCTTQPFANDAPGVYLLTDGTSGIIKDIRFIGGTLRENGGHGFITAATNYISSISIIGMTADSNSQKATKTYDGFHFSDGNYLMKLIGSTSGKFNTTFAFEPRYGFYLEQGGIGTQEITVQGNTFYTNGTGPCFVQAPSNLHYLAGNYPPLDTVCNQSLPFPGQIGANVASASSITATATVGGAFHITGTATINTMIPPTTGFAFGGSLCAIADGAWNMTTAGNIGAAFTAVVGRQYCFVFDPSIPKWYPTGQ